MDSGWGFLFLNLKVNLDFIFGSLGGFVFLTFVFEVGLLVCCLIGLSWVELLVCCGLTVFFVNFSLNCFLKFSFGIVGSRNSYFEITYTIKYYVSLNSIINLFDTTTKTQTPNNIKSLLNTQNMIYTNNQLRNKT